MPRRTHIVAVVGALALAAAACGGLSTPDLSTGAVSGRIVGATTGAFAYPLDRPDLKVATDAAGRFTVLRVPVGAQGIVLFDGHPMGAGRAEIVPVVVGGATTSRIDDRYGDAAPDGPPKMPRASLVLATAHVRNGSKVSSARYTVVRTDQVDVPTVADSASRHTVAELWPVPKGTFDVAASLAGFAPGLAPAVDVPEGATVEVEIDLAVGDDAVRGCASSGVGCRTGLQCESDTGDCQECNSDAECPGSTCSTVTGTCVAVVTGTGEMCDECSSGDVCAGLACVIASGATTGYCSKSCTVASDCPAGFDCQGSQCVALQGCAAYYAMFGSACLRDDACTGALAGGVCLGRTQGDLAPGYCSAQCTTGADCPFGYPCQMDTAGTYHCVQPP
jgi:hypothetical protein